MPHTQTPRKDGAAHLSREIRERGQRLVELSFDYVEARITNPGVAHHADPASLAVWYAIVDVFCDMRNLTHRRDGARVDVAVEQYFREVSEGLFDDPDVTINHLILGRLGHVEIGEDAPFVNCPRCKAEGLTPSP